VQLLVDRLAAGDCRGFSHIIRRRRLQALDFLTKRINHEWAYSDESACTNQAESFFSRIRRAEIGQHHHIAGRYLQAYSREMAWREDYRRVSNGEQYLMVASAALAHPVSRQWKGYWQRANA
jgi:hypothetical protein